MHSLVEVDRRDNRSAREANGRDKGKKIDTVLEKVSQKNK